jgi:hypothetical protein
MFCRRCSSSSDTASIARARIERCGELSRGVENLRSRITSYGIANKKPHRLVRGVGLFAAYASLELY